MSLPTIQIDGRLVRDPEIRFTPSGKAVCSLTVVASRNKKNQQTDQWEETDTTFLDCQAWDKMAEQMAENLVKGDRVMITGEFKQREYETREGEKRKTFEVSIRTIGKHLQPRIQRSSESAPVDDPWASTGTFDDPPPF
jgi:single-strand DNA-binding protein